MRMSRQFIPTLREAPSDAESAGERLLVRAGFIRKTGSGLFTMLPAGLRVLRRIERIIREEMERIGALESLMPILLPMELLKASGRETVFGDELFPIDDRAGRSLYLAPTHEEAFASVVRDDVRSFRSLPLILWQMQMKFRDERRPRLGLLRTREFLMQDAYSFDVDEASLDAACHAMTETYRRIFARCGLDCRTVEADPGLMGGFSSREFVALTEIGESKLRLCARCGYGANVEYAACASVSPVGKSMHAAHVDADTTMHAAHIDADATVHAAQPCVVPESERSLPRPEMTYVQTPGVSTIAALCDFFSCTADRFIKTLIYAADGIPVVVLVRGDRELNEAKLRRSLDCTTLALADEETVRRVTGAEVGFAGPVGLPDVRILMDAEVAVMQDAIAGANRTGWHLAHVFPCRDIRETIPADLRVLQANDPCPVCGAPVSACTGIEVGHVFRLGTRYSRMMQCLYTDASGASHPMQMGCYGIGVGRVAATAVEQNHDANGICWPLAIAPWHVVVVPVSATEPAHEKAAMEIHDRLSALGCEVLVDDRNERAGVKFKDADLIGFPFRITVGRRIHEGIVELRSRSEASPVECTMEEAIRRVHAAVSGLD